MPPSKNQFGSTVKPVRYGMEEHAPVHNRYSPGEPMPTKIQGMWLDEDGILRMRPALKKLAILPDIAGTWLKTIYGETHNWQICIAQVSTSIHIYVYSLSTGALLYTTSFTGSPSAAGIKSLELKASERLGNANNTSVTNKDPNIVFIAGCGAPLKYLYKDTATGLPVLKDFYITASGASFTKNCISLQILDSRLIICQVSKFGSTATDAQHFYASKIYKYDDFSNLGSTSTSGFHFDIPALGGEEFYGMVADKRQLAVVSNYGLSIIAAPDQTLGLSTTNYSFYRVDSTGGRPVHPAIFANYTTYMGITSCRVRAYSQIAALYSPQVEPGSIALPGYFPNFLGEDIASIRDPEILAVLSDGKVYALGQPRVTEKEETAILSPVNAKYPRTTLFDEEGITVKAIGSRVLGMIAEMDGRHYILTQGEGVLNVGAKSFLPTLTVSAVDGGELTTDIDLCEKLYLKDENGDWLLCQHKEGTTYICVVENFDITTATYEYFPAETTDLGPILGVTGSDWSWSGELWDMDSASPALLEGKRTAHSVGVGMAVPYRLERFPLSIGVQGWTLSESRGGAYLEFSTDAMPFGRSMTANLVAVWQSSPDKYLEFNPSPLFQDNAKCHPISFKEGRASIKIRSSGVAPKKDELAILRFLSYG